MKLKLKPEMKLSQFAINNCLQFKSYYDKEDDLLNCFFISKKNSDFLQDIINKIEVTDQKLKRNERINTYIKLINKNIMLIFHTGSENLNLTIKESDSTYFYNLEKSSEKIITLENIHSEKTNWNKGWINEGYYNKDAITDESLAKTLFWSNIKEVLNYNPEKNKKNITFLLEKHMIEQRKKNK